MSIEPDRVRQVHELLVNGSRVPADPSKVREAARFDAGGAVTHWPAIRAMARAANDPHTMLLGAGAMECLRRVVVCAPSTTPGFTLHRTECGFVLGEVVTGSAAEGSGLAPGDVVLSFDGAPVARGMEDVMLSTDRATGTRLVLEVLRGGQRSTRELILRETRLPVSEARWLGDVGYFRLRFVVASEDPELDGARALARALEDFSARSARGLVLDLRSNFGGYGITRYASLLTAGDPLLFYVDAAGVEEPARRTQDAVAWRRPIVVLVDEQTMSAAEMVTLALQDRGAALVVGQPTAGALTVPRYVPLGEGYTLMIPDKLAVGPISRSSPSGLRIAPDRIAPNRTPEDYAEGRDPQLEVALEILRDGPAL
jgi:carboxyl-terminal processing protease